VNPITRVFHFKKNWNREGSDTIAAPTWLSSLFATLVVAKELHDASAIPITLSQNPNKTLYQNQTNSLKTKPNQIQKNPKIQFQIQIIQSTSETKKSNPKKQLKPSKFPNLMSQKLQNKQRYIQKTQPIQNILKPNKDFNYKTRKNINTISLDSTYK